MEKTVQLLAGRRVLTAEDAAEHFRVPSEALQPMARQHPIACTEWLTTTEAAQHLKIKPRTLAQWAREGKAPGHPLSGNKRVTWRFRRSELDGMLDPSSAVPAHGR